MTPIRPDAGGGVASFDGRLDGVGSDDGAGDDPTNSSAVEGPVGAGETVSASHEPLDTNGAVVAR